MQSCMKTKWRILQVVAVLSVAACSATSASSEPSPGTPTWDRPASIKEAAQRIAVLHRSKGPKAAYQFIDACYRTHGLASNYSEAFESCMVQDYLITKMLVQVYARIPEEARDQLNVARPEMLADAMGQRLAAALKTYELPASHGEEVQKLTDEHGLPVFLSVVFPEAMEDRQKRQIEKKQDNKKSNEPR